MLREGVAKLDVGHVEPKAKIKAEQGAGDRFAKRRA